jgi:hypothetical protein
MCTHTMGTATPNILNNILVTRQSRAEAERAAAEARVFQAEAAVAAAQAATSEAAAQVALAEAVAVDYAT